LSFKNRLPYIFVIDEASDFKFGVQLGLARPSSNFSSRKSGCGPGLGELREIWGFPFNITAMAEASDFKFGIHLGFAKSHHEITP